MYVADSPAALVGFDLSNEPAYGGFAGNWAGL
jgi:hypothetical protein